MAKFPLSLLSITILSFVCTSLANDIIETSCQKTRYPEECVQTLTPQAAVIGESSLKLAEIALRTTLKKSQELEKFLMKQAKKPGLGPKEHGALRDCLDGMDDIIDQLTQSVKEIDMMTDSDKFSLSKNNVQTWVSAVLSDHTTCVEGFSETAADPKVSEDIKEKVVAVEHDTSNALALINQLLGPA